MGLFLFGVQSTPGLKADVLFGVQSTPRLKALEDEPTGGATTAFRVASEVGE